MYCIVVFRVYDKNKPTYITSSLDKDSLIDGAKNIIKFEKRYYSGIYSVKVIDLKTNKCVYELRRKNNG